jgi:predicted Fe-Mo cluster-binding NifX family protein
MKPSQPSQQEEKNAMRIAISVENNGGMDATICGHFGHSPFFALVDLAGRHVTALQTVPNPHHPQHMPGAIPLFIHGQGAEVMLTGSMGARAISFFQQSGVQPVTGANGTVRQAIEQYLSGQLAGTTPCRESASHCHDEHGQHQERNE